MSELRRKFSTVRRTSTMLEAPRTPSTLDSASHPPSRLMFNRATSRIQRFCDASLKATTSHSELVKPSSKPTTPPKSADAPLRPFIPKVAKAFASALSTSQLSDFLIWFLYYDVVDLPSSPDEWYEPFKNTEMRGWVELGAFLAQSQAIGQGYGLDLPVLDSICDRLRLQKPLVHDILIKFSSPPKMKYGLLATVVKLEEEKRTLANRLRPTSGSRYVTMQMDIVERINKFLCLYIKPRLVHAREGGPILEHTTDQNLPKEVMEGLDLAFMFEAMQMERKVPLAKYDMRDEEESASEHDLAPSSRLKQHCASDMTQEVADLQQQQSRLEKENDDLKDKVEQLEAKLTIAVAALEDYTGKKVTWTELSSSADEESLPSDSSTSDSHTDNKALPTIRCSWPYGSDLLAASSSARSTLDRLDRRPKRYEDYLNGARTEEPRHRRSGFAEAQELHESCISRVTPLMQGTTIVQQGEEREERSLSRK